MASPQRPCPRRPRIAPALRPLTTAVLLALAANAGAQVLPTGFVVDTGTVSTPVINGAGDTMDINQGSQNAIINWETFSIGDRSEEHTSELQSLMRISYAVFCLKNK